MWGCTTAEDTRSWVPGWEAGTSAVRARLAIKNPKLCLWDVQGTNDQHVRQRKELISIFNIPAGIGFEKQTVELHKIGFVLITDGS